MKKVALALLVIAFAVPAMAAVNISASVGTGADANKVTIGYTCTSSEEVRAFALTIAVSDGAFIVGSAEPVGDPNLIDYWVYPGSITFTVVDGNTVVDSFGTPVAEQTVDSGVLEMASLYAASDPNHPDAPAASGNLCSFWVDCSKAGVDNKVVVGLSLNSKRGGVVLKDPNVTPTTNLPVALDVPCVKGPACWACPRQPYGDATGEGSTNTQDLLALKKAWLTTSAGSPHGTGTGQYNCCADFTQDGAVNTQDLLRLKQNWLTSGAACGDISCP
jgi:hypothetical protein